MIPYLNKGQGNTLTDDLKELNGREEIVYRSQSMKKLMQMVDRVANTDSPVLLIGKSGCGKEMIARRIHEMSYRKDRNFTVINCGFLNNDLTNSKLFGHEKGAFIGATRQKIGLLEKSHKGTILLDEIGDLEPEIQVKLLKFLQEKQIYRCGGKQPITCDVRVICTSNKNLAQEVLKGRFREDLYYRINTITTIIPSLSERLEDVPLLLQHFLGKDIKVEEKAFYILKTYNWPGNIRELKNLCERWRILQTGNTITVNDLPESMTNEQERHQKKGISYNPALTLADLNKMYILNALEYFPSKREAARALGITIKTLYNRLHDYGVFEQYALYTQPVASIETKETLTTHSSI